MKFTIFFFNFLCICIVVSYSHNEDFGDVEGDIMSIPLSYAMGSTKIRNKFIVLGTSPREGSLVGKVLNVNSDGCTKPNITAFKGPYFMLFKDGGCSNIVKVRNAQLAFASAVIVHRDVNMPYNLTSEHDDGTMQDISIPLVIIRTSDVNKYGMNNSLSTTFLSWSQKRSDNLAHVSIWLSPHTFNSMAATTLGGYYTIAKELNNRINFDFHVVIYNASEFGCPMNGSTFCGHNCLGSYCTLPQQFNGKQTLEENFRQLCIQKHLPMHHKSKLSRYRRNVDFKCRDKGTQCYKDYFKQYFGEYDKCVLESPQYVDEILGAEFEKRKKYGINKFPSMYVNGLRYSGNIDCSFPINRENCPSLRLICNTYDSKFKPDICVSKLNVFGDDGDDFYYRGRRRRHRRFRFSIFHIAMCVSIILLIIACIVRRKKRKEQTQSNPHKLHGASTIPVVEVNEQCYAY